MRNAFLYTILFCITMNKILRFSSSIESVRVTAELEVFCIQWESFRYVF